MLTDKLESGLIGFYDNLFDNIKVNKIKLLELGILGGDSLLYFGNYFKNGSVIGFDHKLPDILLTNNVEMIIGWQGDSLALRELGNKNGNFDIIIDDCSHYGEFTQISLDFLWKFLKHGGYYIIEDWTASFNMGEWRGVNDVVAELVRNFDRWGIKSVDILKYPNVVVIKKL